MTNLPPEAPDPALQRIEDGIQESLTDVDRLCAQLREDGPGAVVDSLNAMHEDDVRHLVLLVVVELVRQERGEAS